MQQRTQQSVRALVEAPKHAGAAGASRRSLRTSAAAFSPPLDSHGMPMFSADPFEGRDPPKKVVLAYSGGLDTSVILVRACTDGSLGGVQCSPESTRGYLHPLCPSLTSLSHTALEAACSRSDQGLGGQSGP